MPEDLQLELRGALDRHQHRMELIKDRPEEERYAGNMQEQSKLLFEHEVKALVQSDLASRWQDNLVDLIAAQEDPSNKLREDLERLGASGPFARGVRAAQLSVALGQEDKTDPAISEAMFFLAGLDPVCAKAQAEPYDPKTIHPPSPPW